MYEVKLPRIIPPQLFLLWLIYHYLTGNITNGNNKLLSLCLLHCLHVQVSFHSQKMQIPSHEATLHIAQSFASSSQSSRLAKITLMEALDILVSQFNFTCGLLSRTVEISLL